MKRVNKVINFITHYQCAILIRTPCWLKRFYHYFLVSVQTSKLLLLLLLLLFINEELIFWIVSTKTHLLAFAVWSGHQTPEQAVTSGRYSAVKIKAEWKTAMRDLKKKKKRQSIKKARGHKFPAFNAGFLTLTFHSCGCSVTPLTSHHMFSAGISFLFFFYCVIHPTSTKGQQLCSRTEKHLIRGLPWTVCQCTLFRSLHRRHHSDTVM